MTVREASGRIGISTSLVYALCQAGVILHTRHGRPGRRGKIVISEEALAAYLQTCKKDGGESPSVPLKHIVLN
jgi:excisionase family DNA binding protein